MKFKNLIPVLAILIGAISVSAQRADYEIETILEDTAIEKKSAEINARVIIKNKSEKTLLTSSLQNIHFYFSRCLIGAVCEKIEDTYTASVRIPFKKIRGEEDFEFSVNLAGLYWKDDQTKVLDNQSQKNIKIIPKENIYFYAATKLLDGYKMKNQGPKYDSNGKLIKVAVKKVPNYKYIYSNVLNVTMGE